MITVKQDLTQALRAAQVKACRYSKRLYQVEQEAHQLHEALRVLGTYTGELRDLLRTDS